MELMTLAGDLDKPRECRQIAKSHAFYGGGVAGRGVSDSFPSWLAPEIPVPIFSSCFLKIREGSLLGRDDLLSAAKNRCS